MVLRGRLGVIFFDDAGRPTETAVLEPGGEVLGVDVPPGTWHTVVSLAPGSAFFEAKAGPYQPLAADVLAEPGAAGGEHHQLRRQPHRRDVRQGKESVAGAAGGVALGDDDAGELRAPDVEQRVGGEVDDAGTGDLRPQRRLPARVGSERGQHLVWCRLECVAKRPLSTWANRDSVELKLSSAGASYDGAAGG